MSEETTAEPSPEELGKKTFQVMIRKASGGQLERAIFIGGEMLDWGVDLSSFTDAIRMGPMYVRELQRDIERHFTESVSDFLGRNVTMDEIKEAIRTGWI